MRRKILLWIRTSWMPIELATAFLSEFCRWTAKMAASNLRGIASAGVACHVPHSEQRTVVQDLRSKPHIDTIYHGAAQANRLSSTRYGRDCHN